jgi:hypothetical protein
MAGLFRKIASAFVELDASGRSVEPAPSGDATSEADALIAQLEGTTSAAPPEPEPPPPSALSPDTAAVLGMSAEQVYGAAGLADGPSSAPRVSKMLAGLAQFPPPQQLAMIRALDAADDSWSEEEVLADARARQGALRDHLQRVERARADQLQALEQKTRDTQDLRQKTLAEIDAQMAELTKLREQAVADSAAALSDLDRQKQDVEVAADQARRGITEVVNRLGVLVTFFTSGGPPPRVN